MNENDLYEWNIKHVEIDEETGAKTAIVLQECDNCGFTFNILYHSNGFRYVYEKLCNCESTFHPVNGPSLSEWNDSLK